MSHCTHIINSRLLSIDAYRYEPHWRS